MHKEELIAAIAEKTGISKKDVAEAVSAFVDTVTNAVANGDKVSLIGFGTFEPRKRPARTGRNPHTGEAMEIAAKTVPAFKAGKKFKDAVNEG